MTSDSTAPGTLQTLAEQSAFRLTGRTDEVERLCAAYSARWPEAVRSFEFGRSAEGRPLRALFVSRSGALTAAEFKRANRPILLIQAGIHPGESDGKDAGFIALRELLEGTAAAGSLEQIGILFIPAFNTDGHERCGRWNRPNQVGPEETGWRATAQNLNLNRDYTKADSPEMHAMLRLLNEWDPLVCADMHVTDGANFEPDVSIQVEPIYQGDPKLHASGTQLRDELIDRLAAQGSLPLPFYPDLVEADDPASGFHLTVYSPRFSSGYFPARNRFTMLVETHSWKDYPTRVRVTRNTILGLAELVALHGRKWLDEVQRVDSATARMGGDEIVLDHAAAWREHTSEGQKLEDTAVTTAARPDVTLIEFRGFAYTRIPSPISGELVTTYDPGKPEIWRVPFHRNTQPGLVLKAPVGGYIIPAGFAREIGQKLALHGIACEVLDGGSMSVHSFRATQVQFSATPFEGRMRVKLDGAWNTDTRDIPTGSLFVPIAQSLARLTMALLEPQAPDSFAAWGFFNGCFEQKEFIEPYVAEIIAREMLGKDAVLAEEFERRLAHDPAFARNPVARREFFHRRHASWDERLNLYPIYRLETRR